MDEKLFKQMWAHLRWPSKMRVYWNFPRYFQLSGELNIRMANGAQASVKYCQKFRRNNLWKFEKYVLFAKLNDLGKYEKLEVFNDTEIYVKCIRYNFQFFLKNLSNISAFLHASNSSFLEVGRLWNISPFQVCSVI